MADDERRTYYPSHIMPYPPAICDYSKQSIVQDVGDSDQTSVYRNAWSGALYDFEHERIRKNAVECFEAGLQVSANKPCLGYRPIISRTPSLTPAAYFKWQTYAEIDIRRRSLGSVLEFMSRETMGIGEAVLNVGIWGSSCPEWQIVDLACQAYGKISTILDDLWDPDLVEYVNKLQAPYLDAINLKYLKGIVVMDPVSPETYPIAKGWTVSSGLKFFTLTELEKLGRESMRAPITPTDAQICTICYTHGATGSPKPTIITHGQVALAVSASEWGLTYKEAGITLSSLPLSNVYQRLNDLAMLNRGGAIGYARGNVQDLLEDMQILKPSIWTTIPPVLYMLYQALNNTSSGLKGDLFRKAITEKSAAFHASNELNHSFWDRITFSNARQLFGGNLQAIILAGSPSNPEITQAMRVILSCPIYEAYVPHHSLDSEEFGITETFGPILRTLPHDPTAAGTVGIPLPHMEVKLIDVPELDLIARDKRHPRGELCCRSAGLFLGYYKDRASAAATLDRQGWIHTGDIAEVDAQGRFKIIGRKANIIRLNSGHRVALEQTENAYSSTPGVCQIFVYGDEKRDHLVALVVPTIDYVCQLGMKLGGENVSPMDRHILNMIVRDKRAKEAIQEELNKQAVRRGLPDSQRIQNIHVMLDMFYSGCCADADGMAASRMKINRGEIYNSYKDILDGLYNK